MTDNGNASAGGGGVGRNVKGDALGAKAAGFMDLEVYRNSYSAWPLLGTTFISEVSYNNLNATLLQPPPPIVSPDATE